MIPLSRPRAVARLTHNDITMLALPDASAFPRRARPQVQSVLFGSCCKHERSAMSTTPFFAGRSFNPEILRCMGTAYEAACTELGLKDRDDPITQIVAERVVI